MRATSLVLGLLAETPLHPGAGRTAGAVDLPVAREAFTGYPTIPGSSLKGALRDRARLAGWDQAKIEQVFGRPDGAGGISVTDARILLLPVRSLTEHYRWVTCPYILERLDRDLALAGNAASPLELDLEPLAGDEALGTAEGTVFLEEFSFSVRASRHIERLANRLMPLIRHRSVADRLASQLLILSDNEFAYFANYGLAVNARNVLDDATKTSQNLWYEETLPPDTLLYSLVLARPGQEASVEAVQGLFTGDRPYLQVGGNETIGQGWCAVSAMVGEEKTR